jgi:EAL domain-containing protein (putative c-di-GMP-specific phosphodiesterase class I)/ActR/RegA family two-component response regulator
MNAASPLGILLLEDSPADSRLLTESLRDHVASGSVVIQTVRRLADALRELKRFHFSCVLVDLGLPDGEGVRNVARIREADAGVAIVVLTGLTDERAAEEAFRLGAQDYLIKGERFGDELLAFVRRAIDKVRGSAAAASIAEAEAEGPRYQPWVDLGRGRFGGVHVALGGDIANLSTVLNAFRGWRGPGLEDLTLAISIPVPWLPRMVSQLAARIGQAEIRPALVALRLDVAELSWEPSAVDDVRALRASGTQVWLEGWKPGAAPMDRVTALPLDGLVIDPELVATLTEDSLGAGQRFVRATLALGGALGLDVLADGVGLAEQHQRLAMIGCTRMQGARFATPESADALPARWRKGPWGLDR